MFQQIYDPVNGSLFASALFAMLPLLSMFVMLGWLRISPHLSAAISLLICGLVAGVVYRMPLEVVFNVGAYGAVFSVLTVLWIIVNAIWLYNLTVKSGHFAVLRDSFALISDDPRIQAILIAFSFGALIEALAGAGTPVAIAGAMLVAIGLHPLKAAVIALVADTAPVAFGALAVPITTLAQVTGIPFEELGRHVGHQTPVVAAFVPLVLIWIMDGKRGLSQTWIAAVTAGFSFGIAQWASASFFSVVLADVVGALASAAAVVVLLKFWRPVKLPAGAFQNDVTRNAGNLAAGHSRKQMLLAYAPYALIIAIFTMVQFGVVQKWLSLGTFKFAWPGLAISAQDGKAVGTMFTLNTLSAAGSLLLLAGAITAMMLKVSASQALETYGKTLVQMRWAVPTVLCVMALAFIMNYSGQTGTLGRWLAGTGSAFAFLSPVIGWIGVAVTGSDNSANALFGALQVAAAHETGLSPALLAAANASGGVLGKMISPQSLAVGAAAVGIIGQEGLIFRKVIGWSLSLLLVMAVLVYLQSTSVLSWML
ncbi:MULTISPECIES: L-lactate permease [unclassified Herbaspirillum]|uniref:L-lactate permease n=1 Tax=unclassified Herbaspirillum TaxID=2624150 RepID=UPI00114D8F20|nr:MULTISPECIES: L-lactate permease [unclassified Herbaspirillum]MBB5390746.1 lactate permease [Herbaspirillum sp. SJZ102]TQK08770.1 lactate permease [Herbaspirillum sp. SJZ130]TQK14543.1 lactate permease [Herbaspirillum sp. SJZ106]